MEETAANLQHGYAPYGSDRQTDVPQKRDKRVKINAKGPVVIWIFRHQH